MDYKKPQSTLVQGGVGLYPLTTADQVILADGSRLEKDGRISADSAANSAKLGGKAPEYYLQPRNLLDNSDFRKPVNQRGQTSYNSVGYTIDRWTKESNAILTISDDCINIDNSANSTEEVIIQKVDSDTAAKLIGKTVTIAICTSDGTVYANSGVVAYDVPVALIEHNGFTFQLQFFRTAESYQVARLIIWIGANISVKWAALYEGSYTADTLPPYVSKGYAAELAECQRYFWLCDNSYFSEGCGYAFSPTECRFMISTPQTMRISPSIIADNNNTTSYGIKLIINSTTLTPTSVSVRRVNNRLCLTLLGKFTTNAVGVMRIESQLSFSADL